MTHPTLTAEQLVERAIIVHESDAVCSACGADPRARDGAAVADPAWLIDAVLVPDNVSSEGEYVALVRCPRCRERSP